MTKSLKDALPRTLAPIGGAIAFHQGIKTGITSSLFAATYLFDSKQISERAGSWPILSFMAISSLACGIGFGIIGYAEIYGKTNLALNAFPALKQFESSLLLGSGVKPQFYLFCATSFIAFSIEAMVKYINGPSESVLVVRV